MNSTTTDAGSRPVQIVGPDDHWILERLARQLAAKLPYAEFVPWRPRPGPGVQLAYYVNYALYQGPSGLIDVGFFTHYDPAQQFLERAQAMDACVCECRLYADWLQGQGVRCVRHLPMGFDGYRFRPKLVLGVIGRLDHPRKGKVLVDHLRRLPFIEIVTTDGQLAGGELPQFYQRVDYVLIPATVEGGPLSLLEGLAMGRPIIAPAEVGMVPEFVPSEFIRTYPAGAAAALEAVVRACYTEKVRSRKLVQNRTWDHWAAAHHEFFTELLAARGHALPPPAPGFRFGLLGELELPWDHDLEPLEATVDQAAAHLYFGRQREAQAVLEQALPRFPCVRSLLETLVPKPRAKLLR